jgi:hypothetical protein
MGDHRQTGGHREHRRQPFMHAAQIGFFVRPGNVHRTQCGVSSEYKHLQLL